jgi:hypothetical protein
MTIFVGFESANSYVKSVSSIPGSKVDIYLNTLTFVDEDEVFDPFSGERYPDVYEVEMKNGEKIYCRVGFPLESDNQTSSSGDDIKRYETLEWKVESLIAIFRQLSQGPDTKEFLCVTTGVPTKHAGNTDVIETIKNQLIGTHTVNGRSFLIKDVAVISQAESTYYHELLNDRGEANKPFVVRVKNFNLMYIDIGHGTTDYFHVQRLVPGKRSQINGMSSVWEKIKRIAEQKDPLFKVTNAPILGIESQLQSSGVITFKNITVDVSEEREKELEKYADKILSHLSKDGLEDMLYNEIIFCGGGAVGLRKYLEKVIQKRYATPSLRERFRFLDDSQEANARGYLKYSMNVLASVK